MATRRRLVRPRRLLTPQQEKIFRRAWADGLAQHVCARLAGITYGIIRQRLQDQLADLPRRGRGGRGGTRSRSTCPTEDEIYGQLTREVQATWTDEEREEKWHAWPDR